jgi:mycoredoxin-dependent peroxiredoxin
MAIEVGSAAPDFTLRDAAGDEVRLSGLRGRSNVVLVFFPTASSEVCSVQFAEIAEAEDRYAAGDARVLGISVDGPEALGRFAREMGLRRTALLSDADPKGAVARAYGVHIDDYEVAGRATFVIDREGVVRARFLTGTPLEKPDQEDSFTALTACNR